MKITNIKLPACVMGQLKEYVRKQNLVYVINYLLTLDYDEVDIFHVLTGKPFSINKEELLDTFKNHYSFDSNRLKEVA